MTDQYSGEKIAGLLREVDSALRRKPDVQKSNNTKPDGRPAPARKLRAKALNRKRR
jgi:hypothetical protein